ncbi:MAG: type II secretion system F family protein [Aquificaceae bacterium]
MREKIFKRGIDKEELGFTLIQLGGLLGSGLTLSQALESVSLQTENQKLKRALERLKTSIERGEPLRVAVAKVGVFPEFLPGALAVAERGEGLERVLTLAGESLRREAQNRARLLNALSYPAFVIFASVVSVLIVARLVVPKIEGVLSSIGKELPLITKGVLLVANLVGLLVYFIPLIALVFVFRHRIFGKERVAKWALELPIAGKIGLYYELARFAGSLRLGLLSGLSITRALELAVDSLSNAYLKSKLRGIDLEVAKGRAISKALSSREVIPGLFISLLSTGERGGEIEKMLGIIEETYEAQARRAIELWLRFVEPVAMIVVGAIVALVVLSVVLPLSEVSGGANAP